MPEAVIETYCRRLNGGSRNLARSSARVSAATIRNTMTCPRGKRVPLPSHASSGRSDGRALGVRRFLIRLAAARQRSQPAHGQITTAARPSRRSASSSPKSWCHHQELASRSDRGSTTLCSSGRVDPLSSERLLVALKLPPDRYERFSSTCTVKSPTLRSPSHSRSQRAIGWTHAAADPRVAGRSPKESARRAKVRSSQVLSMKRRAVRERDGT